MLCPVEVFGHGKVLMESQEKPKTTSMRKSMVMREVYVNCISSPEKNPRKPCYLKAPSSSIYSPHDSVGTVTVERMVLDASFGSGFFGFTRRFVATHLLSALEDYIKTGPVSILTTI